jgi:hypothetical protein
MENLEETVQALERCGTALGAGDLPAVAACWEVPAMVLSESGRPPGAGDGGGRAILRWGSRVVPLAGSGCYPARLLHVRPPGNGWCPRMPAGPPST